MLGSLIGGVGGALGAGIGLATAPDDGDKFRKAEIDFFKKLKASNYDFRALSPPELQAFAKFFPETYQAVVPPEVRQAADSQEGRQAQLGAMSYLGNVRDRGLPVETRIAAEEAQRGVSDAWQGRQNAVLEDLSARGRLGGGSEIAARIGGNQQAMELARGLGSELARQEIEKRMQANLQLGSLGSQERGQTQGFNLANADNVNRFNQWFTNTLNQAAKDNAMARERAGFANTERIQSVGDANEQNKYNVDLANLMRQNDLRSQQFEQELARAQGLAGSYRNIADARDARRAAYINTLASAGKSGGQAGGGLLDIL